MFAPECRSGRSPFVDISEGRYRAGPFKEETAMTQYLLAVHMVEGEAVPPPEELAQMYKDVDVVNDEMKAQGAWVFGGGLHPADTATVVRVTDGKVLTTDGPFAETKEQLGGFWIIEAADLDAALAWAAKATVACQAPVEVRPFQDEPEG